VIYIGIDPGLEGAIAAVHALSDGDVRMRVDDMPVKASGAEKTKRTVRKRVDGLLLSNLLEKMCEGDGDGDRVKVYIEEVWSNPHQGVASMFSFGVSYGAVIGAVEAMV
jgi:crossover junction endodeoxyribonuclease RuvC